MVEWQTRKLEVLVGESPWGFKSPLAHHDVKSVGPVREQDGARFASPGGARGTAGVGPGV